MLDAYLHIMGIMLEAWEPQVVRDRRGFAAASGAITSEGTRMITEGKYSAWFRTPIGEGAGACLAPMAS